MATETDISIRYSGEVSCPSCSKSGVEIFYETKNIPVDGAKVFNSHQTAIDSPCADISLCFCCNCGYIFNRMFSDKLFVESGSYEDQQGFSKQFMTYASGLVDELIEKYNLKRKKIVEIGCGKGDLLKIFVEKGNNIGIGIDPRSPVQKLSDDNETIRFIDEKYKIDHGKQLLPDFIYCRHTLEHIETPLAFIKDLRESLITLENKTKIFFELPDMTRILEEAAFWDIYYEHCGYYCPFSLRGLFERNGFEVTEIGRAYQNQHLVLHAMPIKNSEGVEKNFKSELSNTRSLIQKFTEKIKGSVDYWNQFLHKAKQEDKKVAIWGSGSKCVGFLTMLDERHQIKMIVDINSNRHGTYIPKFGEIISPPDSLKQLKPDIVIIMNPAYHAEISNDIMMLGLSPLVKSL